jgi:hypothetical protein
MCVAMIHTNQSRLITNEDLVHHAKCRTIVIVRIPAFPHHTDNMHVADLLLSSWFLEHTSPLLSYILVFSPLSDSWVGRSISGSLSYRAILEPDPLHSLIKHYHHQSYPCFDSKRLNEKDLTVSAWHSILTTRWSSPSISGYNNCCTTCGEDPRVDGLRVQN